jgi:2-dehydro-3-deoxygluconokinase
MANAAGEVVVAEAAGELVVAEVVDGVVDTTAAGDSFAAAYLAARRAGASPASAARAGHTLAGAVVRHRGAIIPKAAMPTINLASEAP